MKHPHIITYLDCVMENNELTVVMELVSRLRVAHVSADRGRRLGSHFQRLLSWSGGWSTEEEGRVWRSARDGVTWWPVERLVEMRELVSLGLTLEGLLLRLVHNLPSWQDEVDEEGKRTMAPVSVQIAGRSR